jgi:flagellar hook protein FlgE
MDISAIALRGLQQAEGELNQAASGVVQAGMGSSGDVVDLSTEMTNQMSAQNQFEANLATLKTADQIEQSLINITA